MRQTHLSFLLFQGEIELLEKITYLEPTLQDNLKHLKKENGKFRIKFNSDDLFEILGAIEFSANTYKFHREGIEYANLYNKLKSYFALIGK